MGFPEELKTWCKHVLNPSLSLNDDIPSASRDVRDCIGMLYYSKYGMCKIHNMHTTTLVSCYRAMTDTSWWCQVHHVVGHDIGLLLVRDQSGDVVTTCPSLLLGEEQQPPVSLCPQPVRNESTLSRSVHETTDTEEDIILLLLLLLLPEVLLSVMRIAMWTLGGAFIREYVRSWLWHSLHEVTLVTCVLLPIGFDSSC